MTFTDYSWTNSSATVAHSYLLPKIFELLPAPPARIADIGSGNGAVAGLLSRSGFSVTGIEPSIEGIALAREANPGVKFIHAGVEEDLRPAAGQGFDVVLATEVIEHLFLPRLLLARAFELLRPGGRLILSTPYHGYIKNLAISLSGGWDKHFTASWDGGHIKFFSTASLGTMLREAGFHLETFKFAGRMPLLWKSMIAVAGRPPT